MSCTALVRNEPRWPEPAGVAIARAVLVYYRVSQSSNWGFFEVATLRIRLENPTAVHM